MSGMMRTAFLNAVTAVRYGGMHNHPLLHELPDYARRGAAKRMFFDRKSSFFFARIPKNANSTLVRTFSFHLGLMVDSDPKGLQPSAF